MFYRRHRCPVIGFPEVSSTLRSYNFRLENEKSGLGVGLGRGGGAQYKRELCSIVGFVTR
jgi:hypothetical protein